MHKKCLKEYKIDTKTSLNYESSIMKTREIIIEYSAVFFMIEGILKCSFMI
jgi:hypothetical protein